MPEALWELPLHDSSDGTNRCPVRATVSCRNVILISSSLRPLPRPARLLRAVARVSGLAETTGASRTR